MNRYTIEGLSNVKCDFQDLLFFISLCFRSWWRRWPNDYSCLVESMCILSWVTFCCNNQPCVLCSKCYWKCFLSSSWLKVCQSMVILLGFHNATVNLGILCLLCEKASWYYFNCHVFFHILYWKAGILQSKWLVILFMPQLSACLPAWEWRVNNQTMRILNLYPLFHSFI